MAESLPRDKNYIPVRGGIGDDGNIYPFLLDFVTGSLMVEVDDSASSSSVSPMTYAPRDKNFIPSMLGESDTTQKPLTWAIDSRNGYLYLDAS